MQHFLFGYGSLFSRESRANTAHTPRAQLATLHDVARSWCFEDPEGYCALGITQQSGGEVNGVLVHVAQEQLPHFDVREAGYTRCNVSAQFAQGEMPEGKVRVWTYVIDEPVHACDCHPIAQTYLDVVLVASEFQ